MYVQDSAVDTSRKLNKNLNHNNDAAQLAICMYVCELRSVGCLFMGHTVHGINGLPLSKADFRNPAGSPRQGSMFQVLEAEH